MSTESRLFRLEKQVVDLIKTHATLEASVTTLNQSMSTLQLAVTGLTAALNKSKGALWTGGIVGAGLGTAVTGALVWFKGHG